MRRKTLSSALAVLLSFTMVAPAFASVANWETGAGTKGESDSLQQAVSDAADAAFNDSSHSSKVYLNEDTTIDASESYIGVVVNGSNQTIDLQGNKLTIENGIVGVSVGSQTTGISITNGTIELNGVVAGVQVEGDDLALQDVTISANLTEIDGVSGSVIFAAGDSEVTLNECVIDAEDSELFTGKDSSTIAVESGSYTGNITEDSYKTGENNAAKNDEFSSEGTLVVTNDNTAAVVKDEKGNVKTYSDLNKAVEKSGDQPVTVLKTDDVANLDIKADTTLNLVAGKDVKGLDEAIEKALASSDKNAAYVKDADGKYHTYSDLSAAVAANQGKPITVTDPTKIGGLLANVGAGTKLDLNLVGTDGASLDEAVKAELDKKDLILNADGTVAAKPVVRPVDPGTWEPVGPIEPVRPGPSEVEIDDPDTPLAGFPITLAPTDKLTRGMLMSILHWMDEAPAAELASFIDVAADSDYAEAIGWASANGIANGVGDNKFAPEDGVTRGQLVTFLNRYAAYVGSDVTVELNGDANEVITWAVAEEIINDFFARLNA